MLKQSWELRDILKLEQKEQSTWTMMGLTKDIDGKLSDLWFSLSPNKVSVKVCPRVKNLFNCDK